MHLNQHKYKLRVFDQQFLEYFVLSVCAVRFKITPWCLSTLSAYLSVSLPAYLPVYRSACLPVCTTPRHTFAAAGVYSQLGAAGLLSGYTHMTITVCVLVAEALGSTDLIIPMCIVGLISRTISSRLAGDTVDEFQVGGWVVGR